MNKTALQKLNSARMSIATCSDSMSPNTMIRNIIYVLNDFEKRIADLEFEIAKLTGKVEPDDEI